MKKLYLTLGLVGILGAGRAQTPSYTMSPIPYNPDPFASGVVVPNMFDDVYSDTIPLPFSFCFYNQSYDKIVISSNGYITFDLINALHYSPWPIANPAPDPAYPILSIFAPYQDINPALGGSITYDVKGVAPYRRFIVSYYQIPMFSCTNMLFSEQVILYETTNIIETHILSKPLCTTWNNGSAVHGINIDQSTAFIVPGRNSNVQWTDTLGGYRFEPVGPCAGNGPSGSVSGQVYIDYNNNCVLDGGDSPVPNRAVLVDGGAYYGWTDSLGMYSIPLDSGPWTLSEMLPLYYASGCPASGTHSVNLAYNQDTLGLDFGDSITAYCPDLWVDIGTPNMTRCGTEWVGVNYCNQGTLPDSNVMVTVTLNDSIGLLSSSIPNVYLGNNQYGFLIGTVAPGQCGHFNLNVSIGCDTVGTVYCMEASIAGAVAGDCDTLNNVGMDCHALIAALDPNLKQVASQDFAQNGYVTSEEIDDNDVLHYLVHFQNTGNDYAYTVVIRDTLSSFLEPSSLQMGAASANYNWTLVGNVLTVEFPNIMLPDSNTDEPRSHGFFKFTVAQTPGNQPGTHILNDASIYFDFEAPVVTNTTDNFIPLLDYSTPVQQAQFALFPNPGSDRITLRLDNVPQADLILTNTLGQVILRQKVSQGDNALSTTGLPAGLYLYRLEQGGIVVGTGKWAKK